MYVEAEGAAMAKHAAETNGHFRELSEREGFELFDEAARFYLDIPGQVFLERFDAGEFEGGEDDPDVSEVIALIPFARA